MDPEHVPLLINAGIGAVLLYLYMKQSDVVAKMQEELTEVRRAQWALLVSLFGEEHAEIMTPKPRDATRPTP